MEGPQIEMKSDNTKFSDALHDAIIAVMQMAQKEIEHTQPRDQKTVIGFRNGKILHIKQKKV